MNRTEELIYYNELFDVYGNLLTEREKEIFTLFYIEDLSLQEIAEVRRVSKSSIGKTVKIICNKLDGYEQKLRFLSKLKTIKEVVSSVKDKKIREKVEKTLENEL